MGIGSVHSESTEKSLFELKSGFSSLSYTAPHIFEISAKFLTFLHQHFFRAPPRPVEIVCSRGCEGEVTKDKEKTFASKTFVLYDLASKRV